MTYSQLVKRFGNANRAARSLGYSRKTLSSWKDRGFIPYKSQCDIQIKLAGELKARRPRMAS